ncbi:MAG: zf-TFIIB domain-containing protein [Actinomycetota bacterium]|nr:zf-TFIIB domain-containing protein [Actinomycetota bacterium]
MICPKCQGRLRTVDRHGLSIEQCEECRGIFLDHGELEHMQDSEQRYYGGHRGRADSPRPYRGGHADSPRPHRGGYADSPRPHRGGYADSPRPHRGGYADSPRPHHGGHDRRRSFLGDLFG